MTKNLKIFIIFIVVAIGILMYQEANQPEPINWFPSYSSVDKIPLGTFVSHSLIKESFKNHGGFRNSSKPPYESLTDNDTITGTYVFINGAINFDKDELDKLLSWVANGNTLFISANAIASQLLDTLAIETSSHIALDNINTKPLVTLINKNLKTKTPFLYDRDIYNSYFSKIDTVHTTILGVSQLYNDTLAIKNPKANYIQQQFGSGQILLHTFPEAFSNYFMLKDANHQYTQNLLAYLNPRQQVIWDSYYKSGKKFYTSPLFLLLSNRYLKWSYYFVVIGVILFVIFEGKRKQRSIPIIAPLKNQTLAFTRTISGMYYEKEKHKEIATKQQLLFLEYIRNTLRIPTNTLDKKTMIDIASRSNNTIEDTIAIFNYFDILYKKSKIEKEELMHLYELITTFKKQS
ncbi:DUF4350 domain-containing protein [Aquimarina longa]|uniref:DUF4350 domain-containing protein n=1 Tax=Aquimarina longa TaxID=1080221 RepID=UPI0007865953|nr:DUF4350 domain-containing protein [Aquimarina longa]